MDKSLKIYISILVLLLTVIVIIDMNKPLPIDWSPTYGLKDKIPMGMYVFNEELPTLLKNQKIQKVTVTPYEYLKPLHNYDTLVNSYKIKGTFLVLSDVPILDNESTKELFYFADQGNTIFLSMKNFPKSILDSLKLEVKSEFQFSDSIYNWMANPKLSTTKYNLVEGIGNSYFSIIDTLNTSVLGYQSGDSTRINYIKVPYKSGNFYLHTQPAAFVNVHLLKKQQFEYAENVLSYLPKTDVFWYVKDQNGDVISNSPLRYIFSQLALKSAWFLFLIGMLIFMVFNAKRRQRIVPIVKPLSNTTIEFAKTIGNLYFQEGDHGNLIDKKIIYFLEKIRNDYMLDTTVLDGFFIKKLHQKSGKELVDIERVVYLIHQHRKNHFTCIEDDLIQINAVMERIIN